MRLTVEIWVVYNLTNGIEADKGFRGGAWYLSDGVNTWMVDVGRGAE